MALSRASQLFLLVGTLFVCQTICSVAEGPSTYFTSSDRDAAIRNLQSAQKADGSFFGLKNTYYAVSALTTLNAKVPESTKVCDYTKGALKSYDASSVFYHTAILETLGCGKAADDKVKEVIKKALSADTTDDLFYGVSAALLLRKGNHIDLPEREVKAAISKIANLQDEGIFKRSNSDNFASIFHTGLAFQALGKIASGVSLTNEEKKELKDILGSSQLVTLAEEKNGALVLQDEELRVTPLQVTSTALVGLSNLGKALDAKYDDFGETEAVGFAETLLRSKDAASVEDIFYVVEGLSALANNQYHRPLVASVDQSSVKGADGVKVRVTDVMGTPQRVKVTATKVTGADGKAIGSKIDLASNPDDSYRLDTLTSKAEPGFYELNLKVTSNDKKYVGIDNVSRNVKVVGNAVVSDIVVSVSQSSDPEDVSVAKKYKISSFGTKHKEAINLNGKDHLFVDFKIKSNSGANLKVHQTFVILSNAEAGSEIVSVARYENGAYRAHVTVSDLEDDFYGKSGNYELNLVVGDSFVENSANSPLATLNLKYDGSRKFSAPVSPFRELPEISHVFQEPAARPSAAVSSAFTLAVLAPFALLVLTLLGMGVNLNKFPMGVNFINAVGFQATLGAILALFGLYWLRLNMVQTLGYFAFLAIPFLYFSQKTLTALSVKEAQVKRQ